MNKSVVALAVVLTTTAARAQYHKYDVWEENYQVQALLGAGQYHAGGSGPFHAAPIWRSLDDASKGQPFSIRTGMLFPDGNPV